VTASLMAAVLLFLVLQVPLLLFGREIGFVRLDEVDEIIRADRAPPCSAAAARQQVHVSGRAARGLQGRWIRPPLIAHDRKLRGMPPANKRAGL
jgi:hypothetical protein